MAINVFVVQGVTKVPMQEVFRGILPFVIIFVIGVIFLVAFPLSSQVMRFSAFSGMIAVIVLLAWDLASGDPRLQPALLGEARFRRTLRAG